MKIGIYSSIDVGLVHDLSIPYIGVDNGLIHLLNQNITPIKVIGDMDSLNNHELLKNFECIKYPEVKDDTDTALAISYALNSGYTHIDLYEYAKNNEYFDPYCLIPTIEVLNSLEKILMDSQGKGISVSEIQSRLTQKHPNSVWVDVICKQFSCTNDRRM